MCNFMQRCELMKWRVCLFVGPECDQWGGRPAAGEILTPQNPPCSRSALWRDHVRGVWRLNTFQPWWKRALLSVLPQDEPLNTCRVCFFFCFFCSHVFVKHMELLLYFFLFLCLSLSVLIFDIQDLSLTSCDIYLKAKTKQTKKASNRRCQLQDALDCLLCSLKPYVTVTLKLLFRTYKASLWISGTRLVVGTNDQSQRLFFFFFFISTVSWNPPPPRDSQLLSSGVCHSSNIQKVYLFFSFFYSPS